MLARATVSGSVYSRSKPLSDARATNVAVVPDVVDCSARMLPVTGSIVALASSPAFTRQVIVTPVSAVPFPSRGVANSWSSNPTGIGGSDGTRPVMSMRLVWPAGCGTLFTVSATVPV